MAAGLFPVASIVAIVTLLLLKTRALTVSSWHCSCKTDFWVKVVIMFFLHHVMIPWEKHLIPRYHVQLLVESKKKKCFTLQNIFWCWTMSSYLVQENVLFFFLLTFHIESCMKFHFKANSEQKILWQCLQNICILDDNYLQITVIL